MCHNDEGVTKKGSAAHAAAPPPKAQTMFAFRDE